MKPRIFVRAFDTVHASTKLRRFVVAELSRPERHWHGLLHHALMLRCILRWPDHVERRRLVHAVLFHDIVYHATRSDNEETSAAVARRWLLPDDEPDAVAALILATKNHDLTETDAITRALLMADLAILWTSSSRLYDFYRQGIRREYAHVGNAAYRDGRAAVLGVLERQLRPHLHPDAARRMAVNLDGERAALTAGRLDLTTSE